MRNKIIAYGFLAMVVLCSATTLISIYQIRDFSSSELAGKVTDETGSGALVFGTAPALGTPTSLTLTNATGLPLATGVNTFSSSDLAGRLTDETGTSGGVVLANSPTIVTPTIANFGSATHNHTNSAGGGQLTDGALSSQVTVAKGGTGNTSHIPYALLLGGTTLTGSFQSGGTGTSGQYYKSNGNSSLGTWTTPAWLVADGGTGRTSNTAYGLMAAGTTSGGAMQQVGVGLVNQVLLSGGSGALPSFSNNFGLVHKSGNINVLATGITGLFTTDPGKGSFVIVAFSATVKTLTGTPTGTFVAAIQYAAVNLASFSITPANATLDANNTGTKVQGQKNIPTSTQVNVNISTAFGGASAMTMQFDLIGYYIN